ncbi:MAG: VCBS repeat-containing protein [Flavobacteriales bacterium]|nr:VCBS repeat-containing protein [Flavobacteriales bacterium]
MEKTLTLLLALSALPTLAQDQCATALPITAGLFTVSAVDGTDVPFPFCAQNGAGATAAEWYTYTPMQDLSITITTDLAANVGDDTRFHVYTGGCAGLVCAAGDDDSGAGNLSAATFNVLQGVTYLIAFDNRWSSTGFDFQVIEQPPVFLPVSFHQESIGLLGYANCVVDMDHDNLDDVVGVGRTLININYQQALGGFVTSDITTDSADFIPTWSLCAGDLDGNGANDLLYAGSSGVTFMLSNSDATAFTEVSGPEYVFCQRSNMVDINNDGHLDAFVCHDVDPNVYYVNDGNGNLNFVQGGLGDVSTGGNYGSIWIDYDNDHDIDLFIAKCRGGTNNPAAVDELHRNNGDGTYTEVASSMNLADYHQSWSAAWADYDNDGDLDILIGASSFTNGGHKLMRNDGSTFTNITPGSGFDTFTGTTNEWTTHDFNNDGYADVLGGGDMMMNNGDLTFTQVNVDPGNGPIGDLNNDGFLDVLNGTTMHLNDGNDNNWLRVHTVGTVSNKNGIGARVEVTSALGTQIRDIKSGDGFRHMSSLMAHFGLGTDTHVDQVTVYWPSGLVNVVQTPAINEVLTVEESISTALPRPTEPPGITLFPNPAGDELFLQGNFDPYGSVFSVLDIAGKRVLGGTLMNAPLDVSALSPGTYMVRIDSPIGTIERRFAKAE